MRRDPSATATKDLEQCVPVGFGFWASLPFLWPRRRHGLSTPREEVWVEAGAAGASEAEGVAGEVEVAAGEAGVDGARIPTPFSICWPKAKRLSVARSSILAGRCSLTGSRPL